MKVFISWSGTRSERIATILREWLPSVLQATRPFMSGNDIRKGTRWVLEIGEQLEDCSCGLLCVTESNVGAPWLNFEAGALSKVLRSSTVIPILFGVTKSTLAGGPLSQFQAATFTRDEMFDTLKAINAQLEGGALTDLVLQRVFDRAWGDLHKEVSAALGESEAAPAGVTPIPATPREDLSIEEMAVVALYADLSPSGRLSAADVASQLKVKLQRAAHLLEQLDKSGHLHALYAIGRQPVYMINTKGREVLVARGLI